eukprot:CAMPEP_0113534688 /NCGR_PEP_ID=MMETSP0015_2-20120614/5295_1 /TAXON_ID=2838 /ORGANISM="Odontella" /LENGTH=203 /DNA_ID=CAMNT_0000433871 /DNA_START=220 /DNA_END=831 /DNA_ORIENTATION=+ /assembly_acc=CAM_ASM_000160
MAQRKKKYFLRMSTDDDSSVSVGDLVKGLHGGKYQFDDPSSSMLPGMSYAGQEFAESLYSDSHSVEENLYEQEMPRWAKRMAPPDPNSAADVEAQILEVNRSGECSKVEVRNLERTWEKYYAVVMRRTDSGTFGEVPFLVKPGVGMLAPRGGANNACDPGQPYSDSAEISVSYLKEKAAPNLKDVWLVVATEEMNCYYRLSVV